MIASERSRRYDPTIHRRRSIRLRHYDYTQEGAYFVTICTQDRECLFGEIVDGAMRLNQAGLMVQDVFGNLPKLYPGVGMDAFVVMPNHVHAIVVLARQGPNRQASYDVAPADHQAGNDVSPVGAGLRACPGYPSCELGQARRPAPTRRVLSLPDLVHRFKTYTTSRYIVGVRDHRWLPFPGRLWQRNYYEHVIRSETTLRRIREYVDQNPARWELDQLHPDNPSKW